jgi:S-adenosylmethionine:tRNA-ribosyltransferase-isomerase (queuine synthetase)
MNLFVLVRPLMGLEVMKAAYAHAIADCYVTFPRSPPPV